LSYCTRVVDTGTICGWNLGDVAGHRQFGDCWSRCSIGWRCGVPLRLCCESLMAISDHDLRWVSLSPRWVLLVILAFVGGCSVSTKKIESGTPLNRDLLAQIKPGVTTGSEVMRMLGPPHSIIRGQAEFLEVSGGVYESHVERRRLSSLDDKQYALFYRYGRTDVHTIGVEFIGESESQRVRHGGEELFVIVDEQSDVVVDYATRVTKNVR
jgi:hypothetical protein